MMVGDALTPDEFSDVMLLIQQHMREETFVTQRQLLMNRINAAGGQIAFNALTAEEQSTALGMLHDFDAWASYDRQGQVETITLAKRRKAPSINVDALTVLALRGKEQS